jgi:hypothetical protein
MGIPRSESWIRVNFTDPFSSHTYGEYLQLDHAGMNLRLPRVSTTLSKSFCISSRVFVRDLQRSSLLYTDASATSARTACMICDTLGR